VIQLDIINSQEEEIPEHVSIKLQQYLSKMNTRRRLEIAILISGISLIGFLWIWILSIWWMAYRNVENDFVSLWSKFPPFIPEGQFRTVFNEETYPLFTNKAFIETVKGRNSKKKWIIGGLIVPFYGWAFFFVIPIIICMIFFIAFPIFFLSIGVDSETLFLIQGLAGIGFIGSFLIYGVFIFHFGIRSLFIKEFKEQQRRLKKRHKLDSFSESFVAQDEFELTTPAIEPITSFHVKKKPENLNVFYKIKNIDNHENMLALRSSLNRLATFAMIILPIILFFGITTFGITVKFFLFYFVFFLLLLLIIFVPNKWILVRRITLLDEHGTPIGSIKGNLHFTRWKVSDLKGEYKASINFSMIEHRGEINIQNASLYLWGDRGRTNVVDYLDKNHQVFSVISPESVYVRKQFSIESNDQINPFLVIALSVCIIERYYKPQSQSN